MPNQFLDIRGRPERITRAKDRDAAAQGMFFGQGHIGQKMIFGPMMVVSVSSQGNILPSLPGVQYYIHSWSVNASNEVSDDNTALFITATVGGVSRIVAGVFITPLVAGVSNGYGILDIMTDVGLPVVGTRVTANVLAMQWTLTYQEVRMEDA